MRTWGGGWILILMGNLADDITRAHKDIALILANRQVMTSAECAIIDCAHYCARENA